MFFQKKHNLILTPNEIEIVLQCIRVNESKTSGEIRLCIESHCPFIDAIERAKELFFKLKMQFTEDRNAVLIYIAYNDRDFALFCDGGIYKKTTNSFWQLESKKLAQAFNKKDYLEGITQCINQVGHQLQTHFPWEGEKKNELPDEIIFGK